MCVCQWLPLYAALAALHYVAACLQLGGDQGHDDLEDSLVEEYRPLTDLLRRYNYCLTIFWYMCVCPCMPLYAALAAPHYFVACLQLGGDQGHDELKE